MKNCFFWWVHHFHCEEQGFLLWIVAKSCTTLDGRKLVNNGVNHLSTGATGAGFRNHPQYVSITGQSCWKDHGLLTSQCLAVTQRRSLWQTACKQIGVFLQMGVPPNNPKVHRLFYKNSPDSPVHFLFFSFSKATQDGPNMRRNQNQWYPLVI